MTDEKNTGAQNVQPAEDKKASGNGRNVERHAEASTQRDSNSIDREEGNMNHGETGNSTLANSKEE